MLNGKRLSYDLSISIFAQRVERTRAHVVGVEVTDPDKPSIAVRASLCEFSEGATPEAVAIAGFSIFRWLSKATSLIYISGNQLASGST